LLDAEHGSIRRFVVAAANIHDSYVWADIAYSVEHFKDLLSLARFENRIHEKGSRNHSLSAAATERNSIKSQIRTRENMYLVVFHINGRQIYKINWAEKE
jgi:IS5 family transposase